MGTASLPVISDQRGVDSVDGWGAGGLASQGPPLPLRGKPRIDGLYIHTPFCFHKCHYCDFYSIAEPAGDGVSQSDRQGVFTERLIGELKLRAGQVGLAPRTIFVGGGTPTLLRVELWRNLLGALEETGCLGRVEEFTVEANPETVSLELMGVLKAGGVNRVSVGAQSFDTGLLKTLERWHDPVSVPKAVGAVRGAGIDNINLDLIFAIPGQTLAMLDADLDAVLALEPDHLSCYGLTYEPNTPMTARLRRGEFRSADEAVERRMYGRVIERLAGAGYEHYEVSNWARPGRQCRHNMAYWENRHWLGIGPSAASHMDGYRWKNLAHLGRYIADAVEPPTADHEHLPPDRRVGELLMLQLRLLRGVGRGWLDKHLSADDARHATITHLVEIEMLQWTPTHLRLTREGLFVADAVIAELL